MFGCPSFFLSSQGRWHGSDLFAESFADVGRAECQRHEPIIRSSFSNPNLLVDPNSSCPPKKPGSFQTMSSKFTTQDPPLPRSLFQGCDGHGFFTDREASVTPEERDDFVQVDLPPTQQNRSEKRRGSTSGPESSESWGDVGTAGCGNSRGVRLGDVLRGHSPGLLCVFC